MSIRGFGNPDAITRDALLALPPAMQAEGLRLLLEMGQSVDQVQARLRLPFDAIATILKCSEPFRRGGDVNVVAEGV